MDQRDAYAEGRSQGYEAGWYGTDVIASAEQLLAEWAEVEDLTVSEVREKMIEVASESEENARQFSPWEQLAHEINSQKPDWRVDGLWEKYDEGVYVGIKKAVGRKLKTWTDAKLKNSFR